MGKKPQLRTERLLLRRWRATDLEPFAEINADPQVMEHFPAMLSRAQTAGLLERIERGFEQRGYGLWAVELAGALSPEGEGEGEASFAGFVGLAPVEIDVAFAPSVEIGWRLARAFWGRGIATEAADAAIAFGFEQLSLRGLVAYTAARNTRSRRVMERLRMTRNPAEDFHHPSLPLAHPLGPHVLYRIDAERWRSRG